MPKNYCIMQIWAESGKSALPICNYSQILYQFLTFTQNLKRSQNKRKHSKKRELLYKTLNIIFYMVLMIIVLSLLYSICMAFISGKIDDIVGFLITIATLIIIIIIMILCFDESFQDDVEEAANHLGVNVAVLALILSLISLIK